MPDVFCVHPTYAPPELDTTTPLSNRPGWGPSRTTFRIASHAGWQWQWTREHIATQLKPVIDRRVLPVRAGSHLAAERDWHLASRLLGQRGVTHLPIDPAAVIRAIEIAEARASGNLAAMKFADGTVSRLSELHQLLSRCEQLIGIGEQLRRPAPLPDNPPGRAGHNWIWGLYSPERLRELTESVWREALLGYSQLVTDCFPRIGRTLAHAALGRPLLEATLITSDKPGFEGSPALAYTISAFDPDQDLDKEPPLAPGTPIATPHVVIRQITEDEWHQGHSATPRATSLTRLIPRGVTAAAFAAPKGVYTAALDVYSHSPSTELAYKWLRADLKQLGWL
jgi:hypothetical protein